MNSYSDTNVYFLSKNVKPFSFASVTWNDFLCFVKENDSSEPDTGRLVGKGQLSAFTVDDGYEADSEMSSDMNCGTDNLTCCNTIHVV